MAADEHQAKVENTIARLAAEVTAALRSEDYASILQSQPRMQLGATQLDHRFKIRVDPAQPEELHAVPAWHLQGKYIVSAAITSAELALLRDACALDFLRVEPESSPVVSFLVNVR